MTELGQWVANNGLAVVIVLAGGIGIWRASGWLATNVISPVKDAFVEHLKSINEYMKSTAASLSSTAKSMDAVSSEIKAIRQDIDSVSQDVVTIKQSFREGLDRQKEHNT